jgi:hypothetical protein
MLKALVLGSAEGVFAEAEEALKLFPDGEPDAIAVINGMVPRWPGRIDYLCTLHAENVEDWLRARALNGHPGSPEVWSYKRSHGPSGKQVYTGVHKIASDWAGSSGLYTVRCLLLEKFERIVCCGVPMDQGKGRIACEKLINGKDATGYDHRACGITCKKRWTGANGYFGAWKRRLPEIKDYVRSMSGQTKSLLGAPTAEWLAGA